MAFLPLFMHVAIDVREACKAERTGKGQWVYGLMTELLARNFPVTCFTDTPLPFGWQEAGAVQVLIPFSGWKWHMRVASLLRNQSHSTVYVSPTSYLVPYLLRRRFPYVPVVHDLIAFRKEPHNRKARFIERLTLSRTLQNARHIFTVSASTKKDLLAQYPSLSSHHVTPVFAGPMHASSEPSKPGGNTIVCVATLCPRKNQVRLIQAYALLPEYLRARYRLVLAGSRGWQDDDILQLIDSTPGVEWKKYITDAEYGQLLGSATVFALPSLYEGFGLPVLDALACGVPVLTSDRGSLREVAGDAAYMVNPESVESIAHGLERLLVEQTLRERLSAAGPAQAAHFTWQRTADTVISVLEQIHAVTIARP
ncbi:MAG: AprM [Candidatus Peribacteria bacterium]|nr:AprM [Candidatus Peribacteria bacterium]